MRVNIIIPYEHKSGGIIVMLEYFRFLARKGHKVTIYYPIIPYFCLIFRKNIFRRILAWLSLFLQNMVPLKDTIELYDEKFPIKPVPRIHSFFIKDGDVCFATAWPTAYDVNKLSANKGIKYYFVQGYEVWNNLKALVETTYTLPLKIITISPWLTEIIEKQYNKKVEAEVHNGISLDRFYPSPSREDTPLTILMLYHELECKGSSEGLIALSLLKKELPNIRIILFGMIHKPITDFDFEYYFEPTYSRLLELYQCAHIFLFPSRKEGWGMTPIEAMACKCAVVGTPIGSVAFVNNGKNVLLIEPQNSQSAYNGLRKLVYDKNLRNQIAEEGYRTVQDLSWEKSVEAMERVIKKIVSQNSSITDSN